MPDEPLPAPPHIVEAVEAARRAFADLTINEKFVALELLEYMGLTNWASIFDNRNLPHPSP
jgi:hypothetical protein